MHHYSTDQPISQKSEDRFQRYEFSKRIAETIANRSNTDGIVIGIYGAWGDGKTSVLNFIEHELIANNCITIRFNPWRYKGEDELLKQFFETIAKAIEQELLTKSEQKGELLKKYSDFLKSAKIPFIDIGQLLNNIGDSLSKHGIEELRKRISILLQEQLRKVIIFIDDIDRLNKEEIHTVFRLVKLNADFKNTTYILSFDEEMVAAAIGDRFGKGNIDAGKDFLEKIIQVPLTLPKIQREALKDYQIELLNRVIDENKFEITANDTTNFSREFDHIILRLKTPRQAAQYANSISFSVPLLLGEVDLSDLLLIEAIKIFYPKHYEFIKHSPEYFIGGYTNSYNRSRDNKKIEQFKSLLEELNKELNHKERIAIEDLLTELFPKLREAFNNYSYGNESYTSWYINQKIASPGYFERYFSYCVIKGQLSDISFNELRKNLLQFTNTAISELVTKLISQSSDKSFIDKVRAYENEYSWKEGYALIKGIAVNGKQLTFSDNSIFRFPFELSGGQSVYFMHSFFKKYRREISNTERLNFAKELLTIAQPYEFKYNILTEIGTRVIDRMAFEYNETIELYMHYITLAIANANGEPLYKVRPLEFYNISTYWKEGNSDSLLKYTYDSLNASSENIIFLLKSFTTFIYSNGTPEGYYENYRIEDHKEFEKCFDTQLITEKIHAYFSAEEINAQDVIWINRGDNNQTDINIVRQFLHWANQPKTESTENTDSSEKTTNK